MSFKLKIGKFDTQDTARNVAPVKDVGYPYLYGTSAQAGNSWLQNAQYGLTGGSGANVNIGDGATSGQILAAVKIGSNTADANGFIVTQRGRTQYLVQDTAGNQGVCTLVNTDVGNLTANTMSVQATQANTTTFYVQAIKDKKVIDFNGVAYLITPLAAARSLTPPAGTNCSGGVVTLSQN